MQITPDPTYAPPEAYRLQEATDARISGLNEDGTVDIIVIRPTVGRGKGRHYYSGDMLRENAHKFAGWKMYNNHLSEAARRSLGGLPRPIEHQGGRVLASWWDDTVPAEGRYEQGAVMARVKPVGIARQLIQEDPAIMEASINARATGVRKHTHRGVQCWLVEGIEDTGSIDWVSEGGAGGRVASLMEAIFDRGDQEDELSKLADLTDAELVARLRRDRPELVEALITNEPPDGGSPTIPNDEEDDVRKPVDILREALESGEGQQLLREASLPLVEAQVQERLESEREFIIAEANAAADRRVELRDLRDHARGLIEASKLPPSLQRELIEAYSIRGDQPTDALDVVEETDEDGNIVKSSIEVLEAAVQADIKSRQAALREAAEPTRVTGQGGGRADGGERARANRRPLFAAQLQEAGIEFASPDDERALKG